MDPSKDKKPSIDGNGEKALNAPVTQRSEGQLFAWFETGTEGLVWALQKRGTDGYEGLVPIEKGDYLTVSSPVGDILFDGEVDPDYRVGWQPRFEGSSHGQPVALGYWVHWTQRDWLPDDWAKLFVEDKNSGVVVRTEAKTGEA